MKAAAPTRVVYDAQVPIGRQAKYLAALRAQFGPGAVVTTYAIEGPPLPHPRKGRTTYAPKLARIVVAVPA